MTLIFRVENSDGTGAYQGRYRWTNEMPSFLRDMWRDYDGEPDPHPIPETDGLGATEWYEYFGFITPAQLIAWFFREPEDPGIMTRGGQRVVIYRVDRIHVREGHRQSVFNMEQAAKLATMTPQEFLAEPPTKWLTYKPAAA